MKMIFTAQKYDRWTSGPFVICKYDDGFYAFMYFKYKDAKRDSKRLHLDSEPLASLEGAKKLCEKVSSQPIHDGIRLIDAPR
jgi:hypothetical protein